MMRFYKTCAFLLLTTLVAAAAEKTPENKPPPFEKEIKAFEAADAKSPPAKGGVLFVGSSSIKLWTTLKDDFPPEWNVVNRGFGGSKIADSTRYANRIVTPYEPKTIVFYAGDNDVAAGRKPEQVLEDYKEFVAKVRASLPETRIYFISIKPSKARWKFVDKIREANRLVKSSCDSGEKLGFIDVFPLMLDNDGQPRPELLREDGLHMTRAGYEIWRDEVKKVLQQK